MSYQERLCKINMLLLTYRCAVSDILFSRPCMYYDSDNFNGYVTFASCNLKDTRYKMDDTKLCIPSCRTNQAKLS